MNSARTDIAMIKVAIKQLGIRDDDGNEAAGVLSTYRQMLKTITGKTSVSADIMCDRERSRVLRRLRQQGFVPKSTKKRPRRVKRAPGMLSQGELGLIYILWRALEDAGEIENPGKEALCAWVEHYTQQFNQGAGYSAPEFLPAYAAARVIEQLKKWCQRLEIKWD